MYERFAELSRRMDERKVYVDYETNCDFLDAIRYGAQPHKEQTMYEQFANNARRLDGIDADIETAKITRECLIEERGAWMIKNVNDIEIGEHLVPGGKVVVKYGIHHLKHITFHSIDEDTQLFARCYAGHRTNIQEAEERLTKAREAHTRCIVASNKCCREFHDRLVDGAYDVATGTVSIVNGTVSFENT